MIFLGKHPFSHPYKSRQQKQDSKLDYFKLKMHYEGNNLQVMMNSRVVENIYNTHLING